MVADTLEFKIVHPPRGGSLWPESDLPHSGGIVVLLTLSVLTTMIMVGDGGGDGGVVT